MPEQVQNKDHTLLHTVDLLSISDRNVFYQRTGDGTVQTFTTGTITVQLATETFDFESFDGLFTWDAVNHDLTLNRSGLYLLIGQGMFYRSSGAGNNNVELALEEDDGGGFAAIPGATSYVSLVAEHYGTIIIPTIVRAVAGYAYRLRARRIYGSDTIGCATSSCALQAICLIGTPDS
jgi:hypothetical protein